MTEYAQNEMKVLATATQIHAHGTHGWEITAKGKGKLKQRKSQLNQGKSWVPRIPNLSHSDLEHGEQEGDPLPRYQDSMADGWVEYITLDSPQNGYKALGKFLEHQPVLLRGSSLVTGLVGQWSFSHLASLFSMKLSPLCAKEVEILCSDAKRHRFWQCDLSKNIPACSDYHVREPETQILHMTPAEFLQCALKWKERKVMVKAAVLEHVNNTAQEPSTIKLPVSVAQLASSSGSLGSLLESAVRAGIDWYWLDGLLQSQRYGPVIQVGIEIGTKGGLQPAKYEMHDQLMAQVTGRRRVLLLPPSTAFSGSYPYPVAHSYDTYSMVDLEAPDVSRWPDAARLQGVCCVLRPGDVLYIPQYWFVHVHELEHEGVTLQFLLHSGARPPAQDSLALRLSRVLEQRCADVVGPTNIRTWLRLAARGGELEAVDLGTVPGYHRVVMCQGLRDEVEAVMGAGTWSSLMTAMCKGRLMPTPWLNTNFREPLLLTDKLVILEDSRTEEEKRYPTLFRKKLEAEGWHVPASLSTVPVPGYNVPVNYK